MDFWKSRLGNSTALFLQCYSEIDDRDDIIASLNSQILKLVSKVASQNEKINTYIISVNNIKQNITS